MRKTGGVADDRVTCAACKNFGPVGHASQSRQEQFRWWFRLKEYKKMPGCRLTGEHLAPNLPRRCDRFSETRGAA